MIQKGNPFQFLGYLALIQNHLEFPFLIFFRYCEALFVFNLTKQLLYSQCFVILFISLFRLFSKTFIWSKGTLPSWVVLSAGSFFPAL